MYITITHIIVNILLFLYPILVYFIFKGKGKIFSIVIFNIDKYNYYDSENLLIDVFMKIIDKDETTGVRTFAFLFFILLSATLWTIMSIITSYIWPIFILFIIIYYIINKTKNKE